MGVAAQVVVNGERVADLWRGETYAGVFRPGEMVLRTGAWTVPGVFTERFTAEPDTDYEFEISPRGEQLAVDTVFGPLGLAGFLDPAVIAVLDERAGPFSLTLKRAIPR